ncbi:unnamed protein product [Adineta steineri]|uniref:Uncharacterized protein n=1 Tax=Adineta steineri TaxID=433720 RepID=A0A815T2I3_9BILA|nr:unnamed protein product [Adineta steineri]CAF1501929.1 unnamed protein product [Adineta steineri]
MAYCEPIVVLYGQSKSISTINLRLPVSFVLATDEIILEDLINSDAQSSDTCLQRYFIILLESINDNVLEHLQTNHRVQVIYSREILTCTSDRSKLHRIINKQMQQFTLDLTADIVHFLTSEGEKQAKLERLDLVKIYYRQARLLKEWAMSFIKAEPCHILLIPLNCNQENLNSAQEELQNICKNLGYTSVIIRTLDDYISATDEEKPCLLPYSQILLNNEDPKYIGELIRKLSPLRLYLYGNNESISSQWSDLMISCETHVMEDEDSWCAFIENEQIDDGIKWNFGFLFGGKWQIKRLSPINLTELQKNLRFQSALRRAFKTFTYRQSEITAKIFEWYDKCIHEGVLHVQPQLSRQQQEKSNEYKNSTTSDLSQYIVKRPSGFNYRQKTESKGISFIWLDEIVKSSNNILDKIIEPFQWCFFDNIFKCISHIENQLRQQNEIFLVTSGTLGCELFSTAYVLLTAIRFVYIYCSQVSLQEKWTNYRSQIRGVFNDPSMLEEKIKQDFQHIYQSSLFMNTTIESYITSTTDNETLISAPIIVYNQEHAHTFMAHQRTIDTLLCLPHTTGARVIMITELCRIFNDNETILEQVNKFALTYNSNNAIQWYTRDSFLFRLINKILRSSDAEMMFKLRYFLTDLYEQLDNVYKQTQIYNTSTIEKLYRGQLISKIELEYLKQIQGHIISIKTFFSTTTSLQIALTFANSSVNDNDFIPIVFCIETNPYIQHKRPYANISKFSIYQDEDEILFSMGSLFRIQSIEEFDGMNNTPIIYLQMIDQKEIDLIHFS